MSAKSTAGRLLFCPKQDWRFSLTASNAQRIVFSCHINVLQLVVLLLLESPA